MGVCGKDGTKLSADVKNPHLLFGARVVEKVDDVRLVHGGQSYKMGYLQRIQ